MQAPTEGLAGSSRPSARRNTASSLLARILPNQNLEHKMAAAGHSLRAQMPISYTESDTSATSPFSSSARPSHISLIDGAERPDDEDQIQYNERRSSAGHSLRPRGALTQSIKAAENGDKKKVGLANFSEDITLVDL